MTQILYTTVGSTTQQNNPVIVDNPITDLFDGFILFFVVFYCVVYFFKRGS